jgi:membrane protein implicated in regulation of membrane protease activity
MDLLLAPEAKPFAIAALILIGLIGVELIATLVGASLSHWVDHSAGLDHGDGHADDHGQFGGALDWLNTGRVPLLVLIMLALGAFAFVGFVLAAIARAVWLPLPWPIASLVAAAAAVPLVRSGSRAVARIVPRDESYAVDDTDLVGRTAEVTVGPLDEGLPGRVKLRDVHGNWHFLRARAAKGHAPMPVGSIVLLVDRDGTAFLAIPAPTDLVDR